MSRRLIGFDDLLHQTMAHDIFFSKITLGNAAHAFQHLQRVHKAAACTVRQIDLRHIARYDHFGAHTHAGKEHLHR